MLYTTYIMNDNDMREREIQLARQRGNELARKYNQHPQNTFRKPPHFKKSYYVIQWIVALTALAAAIMFIFA